MISKAFHTFVLKDINEMSYRSHILTWTWDFIAIFIFCVIATTVDPTKLWRRIWTSSVPDCYTTPTWYTTLVPGRPFCPVAVNWKWI